MREPARTERGVGDCGEPEDVVERLVTMAEDPRTREQATAELVWALADLDDVVAASGRPREEIADEARESVRRERQGGGSMRELPTSLLGPFVTVEQMGRLSRALRATRTLHTGDRELAFLVLRWDPELAVSWLSDRLRELEGNDAPDVWWLRELASRVGDVELLTIVERASRRLAAGDG